MLLIVQRLTDDFFRFKAPPGMIFLIETINFSSRISTLNVCLIFDEWLEEDAGASDDNTSRDSEIASFYISGLEGFNHSISGMNHKAKYITIGKEAASSVNVKIQIYGQLIKATETDLILAWFLKGR